MLAIRITSLTAIALALSPPAIADDDDDEDGAEVPFEEAELFFELNDTDGDLGIHSLIDGGPWQRLWIKGRSDRKLLNVFARGPLWHQGLTEIFFESAEPTFDELSPASFFRRFPAGEYDVEGWSNEGYELESEVELTHAMPAPPQPVIVVNDVIEFPMAEQCDDEEPGYDAPTIGGPDDDVVIAWPAVDRTHPDIGSPLDSPDIMIVNYEVVVEAELELDGEEFVTVMSAFVPPDVMSMTIPGEFLRQSDTFKYEVLAREESYNQTAVESCFRLEGGD